MALAVIAFEEWGSETTILAQRLAVLVMGRTLALDRNPLINFEKNGFRRTITPIRSERTPSECFGESD